MSKHSIELREDEDEVEIRLPGGMVLSVRYEHLHDESLPELDIMLSNAMSVNCFDEGLVPSNSGKNHIVCKQMFIVLEGESK